MERMFHVSECSNGCVLVTVLTPEMSSVYWESLSNTISGMKVKNCHVVFDFLVRNGLNDRFYETYTDESSNIYISLKKIEVSPIMLAAADDFFFHHRKYIEISALTQRQKKAYLAI